MADYTEHQSIILDVSGISGVTALEKAVIREEQAVIHAAQSHKQVATTVYDFADAYELAEEKVNQFSAFMPKVEQAIERQAQAFKRAATTYKATTQEVQAATTSTRNYGQAALTASYAFQDFTSVQGGFVQQLASVQNNIPGLVTALAGPEKAALAGAISVVSVGIGLALPHLANLAKQYGLIGQEASKASGSVAALEARIKEIEAKPVKLAVDTFELEQAKAQLDALQKAQAAFDSARAGFRTNDEKEAGDQFAKDLASQGERGRAGFDAVRAQIFNEAEATSPHGKEIAKKQAALDKLEQEVVDSQKADPAILMLAERRRDRAKEALDDLKEKNQAATDANEAKAMQTTGDLYRRAAAGNDPDAREEFARRFRQGGFDDLASIAERSSPQEVERKRIAKQTTDLDAFQAEEAAKVTKKDAEKAKQKATAEELNRQMIASYENPELGDKALKDINDARTQANRPKIESQIAKEDQRLRERGYVDSASDRISEIEQNGGALDRFGRWRDMDDPGQIRQWVAREVEQVIRANNPGMNRQQSGDLANRASALADQQFNQSIAKFGVFQPQQAQGAGFRSVPATAPPPPQAQGGAGGGGDPALAGIARAAQGITQAMGGQDQRITAIESILSQVMMSVVKMGHQRDNQLRKAQQDGDSYLPTTW